MDRSPIGLRVKAEKAAAKAVQERENLRQAQSEKRSEEMIRNTTLWRDKIIGRWKSVKNTAKVSTLAAKGIPPCLRREVWQLMIGNEIQLTEDVYRSLHQKAVARYEQVLQRERQHSALRQQKLSGTSRDSFLTPADILSNSFTSTPRVTNDACVEALDADADADCSTVRIDNKEPGNSLSTDTDEPADDMKDQTVDILVNSANENSSIRDALTGAPSPPGDITSVSEISIRIRENSLNNNSNGHGGAVFSTPTRALSMSLSPAMGMDSGHRYDTVALIQWDLPRTFPTLGFFHDGGPLNHALNNVLHAFSCYRPDVGYVQGMSFIVAMLLLYMSELETFQSLINLVGRRGSLEFYKLKKEAIDNYVEVFDYFFKQYLPLLFKHFKNEGVSSEMYLLDWNLSLFCKALPIEVAARVWDCYLLEGEVFVVRAALGLLRMHAKALSHWSMEKIMRLLVHFPDEINVEVLMENINQIRISEKKYEDIRAKFNSKAYDDSIFKGVYGVVASDSNNYTLGSSYNSTTDIGPRPVKKHLFNDNVGNEGASQSLAHEQEQNKKCVIM